MRRPDGGAVAFADLDPDPESGPSPPTRQERAAESAQDAREDDDEAPAPSRTRPLTLCPGAHQEGEEGCDPDLVGAPRVAP